MGPNLQKTDSELVTIMNHIMTNEIFQAIKLEILRRDQRMDTIQSAPLLGVAAPIRPNILAGVAQVLQNMGIVLPANFLDAGEQQRHPMTWPELCALIEQSLLTDTSTGVHSTLSARRVTSVNSASSSSSSSSSSSTVAAKEKRFKDVDGTELKRLRTDSDFAAHSAHSYATLEEMITRIDAIAGAVESLAGTVQQQQQFQRYTPFGHERSISHYQQFPQNQQYHQQGQQQGRGFAQKGSKQSNGNGHQQQQRPQQQQQGQEYNQSDDRGEQGTSGRGKYQQPIFSKKSHGRVNGAAVDDEKECKEEIFEQQGDDEEYEQDPWNT